MDGGGNNVAEAYLRCIWDGSAMHALKTGRGGYLIPNYQFKAQTRHSHPRVGSGRDDEKERERERGKMPWSGSWRIRETIIRACYPIFAVGKAAKSWNEDDTINRTTFPRPPEKRASLQKEILAISNTMHAALSDDGCEMSIRILSLWSLSPRDGDDVSRAQLRWLTKTESGDSMRAENGGLGISVEII